MLIHHDKRVRTANYKSIETRRRRKAPRLEGVTVKNDPVASPSQPIQDIAVGPTFNATGTTGGTVMMVAGHYISGDCNIYSTRDIDGHGQRPAEASNPQPSQLLPPDIFYGRDDLVSDIAVHISRTQQPRIAILGPGGIGKTSAALHMIHHEAVIARYHDRRYFVGLDALSSAGALARVILQAIRAVARPGENTVEAVHRSVWEAEMDHSSIRDLLQKLSNAPSAALVITMRAANPPPGIRWTTSHNLSPLSPPHAKDVFLAINTTFVAVSDDETSILDELLRELDYVPLAIHLLAQISLGLSPAFVLKLWREQKTRLLCLDPFTQDKLESVEVSIALSIASVGVTRNPQAIRLLGVLCLLPDGLLRYEERLTKIAKVIPTSMSDFFLLRKFALIYISGDKLRVLSPIRHFILQHYPPDGQHVTCICNIFWQLVDSFATVGFGPDANSAKEALGAELGNIGHLIEYAVRHHPSDRLLEIAWKVTWYLCYTGVSTKLERKVAALVPVADLAMQTRHWQVSGATSYNQKIYTEAKNMVTQARKYSLAVGDHLQAAQSGYMLGEILTMQCQYLEATAVFTEARDQLLALDNHAGVTLCLLGLGNVLYLQGRYPEAFAMLAEVRDKFTKMGDQHGATHCSQGMAGVMLMQSEYTEASALLTAARDDFLRIGSRLGAVQCLQTLGDVLQAQGKYDEASTKMNEARSGFLKIGDPLGAAQCLQSLGQVFHARRKSLDASSAMTEPRLQFLRIGDLLGGDRCSRSLGRVLIAQDKRAEGASALRQARDLFLEIGHTEDVSRCSEMLEEYSA
ncbi:hypothetical protein HWV62_22650 [Athelia sp. TMB]|nr:hypothetical protein HWV62_22650 [Athelia sp. TMB]